MKNIWKGTKKPEVSVTPEHMDMGVGLMIGRFNTVEKLIRNIISSHASLSGSADEEVSRWRDDETIRFYDLVKKYVELDIFDGARCISLDNIRVGRNHFAHEYTRDVSEFGTLWSLNQELNGMIRFLNDIDRNISKKAQKKKTRDANARQDALKRNVKMCLNECTDIGDGWARLSDLGIKMGEHGVSYDGKLMDLCKKLGFKIELRPKTKTNGRVPSAYIRKR